MGRADGDVYKLSEGYYRLDCLHQRCVQVLDLLKMQ